MDLSDDEDFYDSDQSDTGEQSLHAMLKKTLYEKDNGYEEYGEQAADDEEPLGSIQEEVLGKVTDVGAEEEVVLGPVNSKIDIEIKDNDVSSDASIVKKLDDAEELVLGPEVIGELEKKHFFDVLDVDDFEPLKKKPKLSPSDDSKEENPHKTIIMHVPQFIRCNKGGQSIQVQ